MASHHFELFQEGASDIQRQNRSVQSCEGCRGDSAQSCVHVLWPSISRHAMCLHQGQNVVRIFGECRNGFAQIYILLRYSLADNLFADQIGLHKRGQGGKVVESAVEDLLGVTS